MKFIINLFVVASLNFFVVKGQKDVVDFVQMPEVSNSMASEYLKPLAQMMNSNLKSGWYTTAKTHRFMGFDVDLNFSVTQTPTNKRGYYLSEIPDFNQYYTVKDGSFSIAANVAGVTNSNPEVKSKENGREVLLPKGESVDRLSLPVITGGIGLPYNTEIRLKLMPYLNKSDIGKVSQYGLGIKHGIKDYIPVLEDIPTLSLSVFGAYSFASNTLDVEYPSAVSSNQLLKGVVSGYSGKLLVGIDVPVLSAYMGIGYGSTNVDYNLKGLYFVGDVNLEQEEQDPISVSYKYGEFQFDIGVKAKLGFVDLFVGYTPGEYGTFNIGAGVAFR
ncbi:DUF6588 family protein [Labilibacter marinus]|uniref:DUF6588 family protein n=1 Tax=Labilibacter marinus TaxID=1477105 RepID=UPI00082C2B97|nr:DUF6588 family protein [Labilibacter marinus]